MPDMTGIESTLREGGYTYQGWLATIPQTEVLTGAISAVPDYPALSLSYTTSTGSSADVLRGMTVNVYDSGGRRKGRLRVATSGTLNSTTLPVNEFSAETVDIASGDTFAVVGEFRIWDKLVAAEASFNKDSRIAYTDQNADPFPTANGGGPVAGWVNGSDVLEIDFDATTSFSNDPDNGGNSLTYDWDFIDATPSSSTSATPTGVEFPPGFRHVLLSVTDGVNGETMVKKIPVWAFKAGVYEPSEVTMSERSWDMASGDYTTSFELETSADADIAALPDGALVVYFEKEFYQGVEVSYGSDVNRSNIKFTGFLRSETVTIEPEDNRVSFNAVGLLTILDNDTPALPQLGISDATPDNWREIKALSIRRFLWYLTYWHTTLGDLFDFVFVDGSDVTYQRLYVQNIASAGGQLRDIAKSLMVDLTADRNGRLLFVRDPNMLSSAERAARTTAYNFTPRDRMSLELKREHAGTTKLVKVQALTPAETAVFAKSGEAPSSFGVGIDILTRVIVPNRATARRYAGLRFARLNNLYNGQFVPKGATMALPDDYDVFDPALRDYITETVAASSNMRGLEYDTGTHWTIEAISITYDSEFGSKDITATIDHETLGADGVNDDPPPANSSGIGNVNPPTVDFVVPDFTPIPSTAVPPVNGTGNIAAYTGGGYFIYTSDFSTPAASGGPTWSGYGLGAAGLLGTATADAVPHASQPNTAWVVTTDTGAIRIYKGTDIVASPTYTLVHTIAETAFGNEVTIETNRAAPGFVVCYVHYRGSTPFGSWAYWTRDDGATWSSHQVTSGYQSNGSFGLFPSVFVSGRTPGLAWLGAFTVTGSGTGALARVYQMSNYGASFSLAPAPFDFTMVLSAGDGFHLPYADERYIFYGDFDTSVFDPRTRRNSLTIDQTGVANEKVYRRGFRTDDGNPNSAIMASGGRVMSTANALGPLPTFTTLATSTGYVSGFTIDGSYYVWGNSGTIGFGDTMLSAPDDRSGNIAGSFPFVGTIYNILGWSP